MTIALLLAVGCGGKTRLRSTDADVDDDPWLKIDAATSVATDAGSRDAGSDADR